MQYSYIFINKEKAMMNFPQLQKMIATTQKMEYLTCLFSDEGVFFCENRDGI